MLRLGLKPSNKSLKKSQLSGTPVMVAVEAAMMSLMVAEGVVMVLTVVAKVA